MPHNGARDRQWPALRLANRRAAGEGVMVRRLSVASLDSGAESPVYCKAPAACAGRGGQLVRAPLGGHGARSAASPRRPRADVFASAGTGLGAPPLAAARGLVGSAQSAWLAAPSSAALLSVHQPGSGLAAKTGLASQPPNYFQACASGDQASGLARADHSATRDNLRHVGCRPAKRKMVCKGHPCIYAADGDPMTWFASSMAARRGRRLPSRRTDVHGREG
jgi:hypothetical protein